ncbi:glycosyltransferase family 2 protein [Campylobacter sp. RM13119]|uniref:glycosyltransferase family 2 protein n=1 Tax=Campylobacter californiensis TaxID=1032243 RepID=UPI0014766F0F|nr:glycosyltransferase family 2 protein [Campylobacter sp. RM13119]MBE3605368.1 glycosyltransferase family 2 protein [Campylobacter sp. RM13119]
MNKLVSILIPVYNREGLIEETIKSAIGQTYKDIEVIVVDNKSTDKTWKVLQKIASKDERIKIFQNESNLGPVRNWKRCIDEASGEYAKILWSDDLISPEFIAKTIYFLESKDVGFVFTGTEIFLDETGEKALSYLIGESGVYESEKYINGVLFDGGYPVSPGCSIFRLNDLKDSLLVDIPNKARSDFSMHAIGNDLLIFLLIADKYKKFAFVNEILSFFRAHKGSISIQSNNGKLPLHYNLASSYFIENHRKDLIKKMNTKIWLNTKKYQATAKKYNLNKISNYYLYNEDFSLDLRYLFKTSFSKIVSKLKRRIKGLYV